MSVFFSIITVCLNPGDKLLPTIKSIQNQTETDLEILVKDGGSKENIEDKILKLSDERIRFVKKEDQGIYDAMNQAAALSTGNYVYFLNCGDILNDENVLKKIREAIEKKPDSSVFYGDVMELVTGQRVTSNPRLNLQIAVYLEV